MKNHFKKIAIFRALHLGDLLCAMPAIRLLKQRFPESDIYLIGLPGSEPLVERFGSLFKGLILFSGYPGLPEKDWSREGISAFTCAMKAHQFDLLIQLQGNGSVVNSFLLKLGARMIWGFDADSFIKTDIVRKGEDLPAQIWMKYPEGLHEIHRHLALVHFCLDCICGRDAEYGKKPDYRTSGEDHLLFPRLKQDYRDFTHLHLPVQQRRYVVVHPGSRAAWRQLSPECFARLSDTCRRLGYAVVLTGTSAEVAIIAAVKRLIRYEAFNLAGRTSLGAMAVLLENARGVISNCTGISHIAAALDIPGVIISMDGEPERWGPLNKKRIYTHNWLKKPECGLLELAVRGMLDRPEMKDPCFYVASGAVSFS